MTNFSRLNANVAKPLSRYAPFRRAGDLVFFAGIIAANPSTMKVIKGYSDLPPEARRLAGDVVFLVRGRVHERAAAQDFFAGPATREAQAFLAGDLVI